MRPLLPFEHGHPRPAAPHYLTWKQPAVPRAAQPTWAPLPYEHGQGHPFGGTQPAMLPNPAGPASPSSAGAGGPLAGLFTGSIAQQAQKLANYVYGQYTTTYQQQAAEQAGLNQSQLAWLQNYINQVAGSLSGVAPQVQQAYENAAHDQSAFAQGFSDAVKNAVQGSADQENTLLSQIGAPQGQMAPPGQAAAVGDVNYGLGGYIPATLLAAQGAHAYSEAAQMPGIVKQRGLDLVAQLLGQQQQGSQALRSAYEQQMAGKPGQVLTFYQQLKAQQATNQGNAAAAREKAFAAQQTQAQNLTQSTGYLYVVTKAGEVKRATDRAGKPILTLAGQKAAQGSTPSAQLHTFPDGTTVIFDPSTGRTTPIGNFAKPPNPQVPTIHTFPNGDSIQWDPATQAWSPLGNFAKPPTTPRPSTFNTSDGATFLMSPTPKGGWTLKQVGGPKTQQPIIKTDTRSGMTTALDPVTGKVLWRSQTGLPTPPPTTQPKVFSNGAAWVPQKDGSWKYMPPPKGANGKPPPILDPVTHQPLSQSTVTQMTADLRASIAAAKKHKPGKPGFTGGGLEILLKDIQNEGIPPEIWVPIVMQAYGIPKVIKRPDQLKFMPTPTLRNIALMMGWKSDPAHPFAKQDFVSWITANLPKADAAAETAATRAAGGQYYPVPTKLTAGSEFATVDAEGAPDANGVRHHAAKDWFAPAGTAVSSPIPGTIVEVKQSTGTSGQVFGGVVKVQGANGRVWVFRHVVPGDLKVGDKVKAGQEVATVSDWTDNPSSTHTHIELWKTLAGGYHYDNMIDPMSVFAPQNPSPGASRTPPIVASQVTKYLRAQGSPLAGLSGFIVQQGVKYGIDPRLIVAIAGAETSFGSYKPSQSIHNPFGWGPGISFPSWKAAIAAVAKALRANYLDQGYTTVAQIAAKWAPVGTGNDPSGLNQNWITNVTQYLTALGGDPNSLLLGGL